ncbi:MAG: type II toxin-antitoxin system RelE/ParE family toxin [Nitrosospira sp.]|nr:type II toxin-antitoxin system RelE/ParE family toxin [Nitrosospira sp.]MDN5934895.1 type II toxin-antitoxin system RelE/ParE family toxin [Nitrosospira sp.]
MGEFWKYRVGDYRVIANPEDNALCILVIKIGNRREVYR